MSQRERAAREAAFLLYNRVVDEYKTAKTIAARNLTVKSLPSNYQIALEIDRLASEIEGTSRLDRLLELRREAMELMKVLEKYRPSLIGSVWRGTAHRGSDIDIRVYCSNREEVLQALQGKYMVSRTGWVKKTRGGDTLRYFHAYLTLPSGDEAEVVVRPVEDFGEHEVCEIYGDPLTGLSLKQLEEVLSGDPYRRFLPKK